MMAQAFSISSIRIEDTAIKTLAIVVEQAWGERSTCPAGFDSETVALLFFRVQRLYLERQAGVRALARIFSR